LEEVKLFALLSQKFILNSEESSGIQYDSRRSQKIIPKFSTRSSQSQPLDESESSIDGSLDPTLKRKFSSISSDDERDESKFKKVKKS
jgi:hypothetical protein